jgi:hypothetical protein
MSKALNESLGSIGYDNLFVENIPEADVVLVKLTAAGVVKRGTILSGTPGAADFEVLAAAASASKALYVLAEDCDTAVDTVGIAYRTGHFNRNALIVAEGYALTAADEEILRKSGILLADAIEY